MDVSLRSRAVQLAGEIASQARTGEDLNGLMRFMMESAVERMLNTEIDVHLGRKTLAADAGQPLAEMPADTEPAAPAASPAAHPDSGWARPTVAMGIREEWCAAAWARSRSPRLATATARFSRN